MSLGLANVRVGSAVAGMNNEFSFSAASSLLLQMVPMHPHLDHSLVLQARDSFRVLFIGKKPFETFFFFFALADKGADETFQHRLSPE